MGNLRVERGGRVGMVEVAGMAGMVELALLVIEPMAIDPQCLDIPWNPPLT